MCVFVCVCIFILRAGNSHLYDFHILENQEARGIGNILDYPQCNLEPD